MNVIEVIVVVYAAISIPTLAWMFWATHHAPMDYELWPDLYQPPPTLPFSSRVADAEGWEVA